MALATKIGQETSSSIRPIIWKFKITSRPLHPTWLDAKTPNMISTKTAGTFQTKVRIGEICVINPPHLPGWCRVVEHMRARGSMPPVFPTRGIIGDSPFPRHARTMAAVVWKSIRRGGVPWSTHCRSCDACHALLHLAAVGLNTKSQ